MSAPNYDWLAQLTLVQKKFLEDNYSALYDCYKTYGYSVLLYDYVRELDEVYDRVKSVKITEKINLPARFQDKVEAFYRAQMEIGNLKQIVVAIPNYHVILVSKDMRLISELSKSITDVPVMMVPALSAEDLSSNANCVIFDDVDSSITASMLEDCEMHAIPYIRRTVAGWLNPVLEKDTENILLSFVQRYKPCKTIR